MFENSHMKEAYAQAVEAFEKDEAPVGVVIVHHERDEIVLKVYNQMRMRKDPTAHAEMIAIQTLSQILKSERLDAYDIYVTLEPCAMCAAAISYARFNALYFGAYDVKSGGVEHGAKFFEQKTCHHRPTVFGGILAKKNRALIQKFFKQKRGAV